MAYMNQAKKAELAPGIKSVLKKYGMKGTISVSNHSTLVVTLQSGKLDIPDNYTKTFNIEAEYKGYEKIKESPTYIRVNEYHIDSQYTGKIRDFLLELKTAMMIGNHDNSDVQSDYFDVGWYVNITVGKYNKPYKIEA